MVRRENPETDEDRDLGFGSLASRASRLVERDGSFSVAHVGGSWRARLSLYHRMLTTRWGWFLLGAALAYLAFNLLFAAAYIACGEGAITGPATYGRFLQALFLSVQTSSTVGYGQLAPSGLAANVVMMVQAFCSLVLVALGTGLVFARFSRPAPDIAWSDRAVVAPYRGGTGLMLRIANRRRNQLLDLHAKVMLSSFVEGDDTGGAPRRVFHDLPLERSLVSFLHLSWTIVHPIDEQSPLQGLSPEDYARLRVEAVVLLRGRDATTSQDVHDWTSYTDTEIVHGARFVRIFERESEGGPLTMDVRRIHEYELVDTAER